MSIEPYRSELNEGNGNKIPNSLFLLDLHDVTDTFFVGLNELVQVLFFMSSGDKLSQTLATQNKGNSYTRRHDMDGKESKK